MFIVPESAIPQRPSLDGEHFQHLASPLADVADALEPPLTAQFGRHQKRQVGLPQAVGPLARQVRETPACGRSLVNSSQSALDIECPMSSMTWTGSACLSGHSLTPFPRVASQSSTMPFGVPARVKIPSKSIATLCRSNSAILPRSRFPAFLRSRISLARDTALFFHSSRLFMSFDCWGMTTGPFGGTMRGQIYLFYPCPEGEGFVKRQIGPALTLPMRYKVLYYDEKDQPILLCS